MATIGRNRAIVESWGFRIGGMTAWLAWLFIHVAFLVGFRNRVSVLAQWIWAYATNKRSSRVVFTRPTASAPALESPPAADDAPGPAADREAAASPP